MVKDTEFENMTLEQVIMRSEGGMFNNAAQIWNHTFYFNGLSPDGGGEPIGELAEKIINKFGSFAEFKDKFTTTAKTTFGPGWAWLVQDEKGELVITKSNNAGTPMTDGMHALLTCDVWEHDYYVDTRNDRGAYLNNFWKLVNWDRVAKLIK